MSVIAMKSETYNRFKHHHHHYHHYHNHHVHSYSHINHKGTFLPMLCSSRPLIKDVQVPTKPNSASPNISCMAQVKRGNKVSVFPITTTTTTTTQTTKINMTKYSKLKKLFSGKPFTPAKVSSTATSPTRCPMRTRSRGAQMSSSNNERQGRRCVVAEMNQMINVAEMDPPLPVIKRVERSPQQGEGSLYKRRSGGAIKGLQVQPPKVLQTQATSVRLGRK